MKIISVCAALFVFAVSVFAQNNYTIQQYLNIRSASAPTLSPDGQKMFYLSNITGTSQIYSIDLPNGAPKQISNYEDNIGFVKFSPKGDGVIFGKAKGGDENTQLFWMKPDGTGVKELTANPKVRYNFGDWSDDGAKIYYASNKRDKNFFDVYLMEVASGREESIYRQDGSNDFSAVSGDGEKFIISRSGTELSLDNDLFLFDKRTSAVTPLTKHTGAAQFADAEFLPDGDSIVLTANSDREFAGLAQFDNVQNGANGKMRYLDKNTDWDTESVRVAPSGDKLAYIINREGFSELYLKKIEVDGKPLISNLNFKSEAVKLPAQGVAGGLTFSQDGKFLAFSFNSAKNNSDIWLYDINAKKITQVTNSDRAGIDAKTFVVPHLIKFKTFDGREIPAWYYISPVEENRPLMGRYKPLTLSGRTFYLREIPVIVSVHGGPEGQERPVFNPLYQYYLSKGYSILATNVRGSTGYGKNYTHLDDVRKREDSIKDLAAAAEWLKTSGGADAKRIGIMGGSYGGYATLAAITLYPDLFAAAVDTVGIANWESYFKNTSGYRKRQREVEYGMADKDAEFLRSISPLNKADRIKTPLFVIAGKNDPRVPYTEAEQIVKAVKDKNGIVEYKLYDDEGHGVSKLKNRLDLYPRVADFLDKYMK